MNPIIIELVQTHNIEVTIKTFNHNDKTLIGFDVNTEAKSGLILVENDDHTFTGYGRYNVVHQNLDSVIDIAYAVRDCLCGRNYVNESWLKLMEKLNVITIDRETVTHISIV